MPYVPFLPFPDFAETAVLVNAVRDHLAAALVGVDGAAPNTAAAGTLVDNLGERPPFRFTPAPLVGVARFDTTFEDAIQSGLSARTEGEVDSAVRARPFVLVGLEGADVARAGVNSQPVVHALPLSVVVCQTARGRGFHTEDAEAMDRAADAVLYAMQSRFFRLSTFGGLGHAMAGFEAGAVTSPAVSFRRIQLRLFRSI